MFLVNFYFISLYRTEFFILSSGNNSFKFFRITLAIVNASVFSRNFFILLAYLELWPGWALDE